MVNTNLKQRLTDLWCDDDMRFEAKAQSIAITLASAVHQAGMSRAQLAKKLGWKPSRVTKILTGSENLTLRTIHQVCAAIGLEFDVILRRPEECTVTVNDRQAARMINEIKENLHKNWLLLEAASSINQRICQPVRDSRRFSHCELQLKMAA